MKHILKCPKCSIYTMQITCPECNLKTINPKPPKYSPKDPYASYRRKAKKQQLKKSDLL